MNRAELAGAAGRRAKLASWWFIGHEVKLIPPWSKVISAEIAQCRVATLRGVEASDMIEHIRYGVISLGIDFPCRSLNFQ